MSSTEYTKTIFSGMGLRTSAPRGWPHTATGTPVIQNWAQYRQWRETLKLPEESSDFSDHDVFDVAFHLIDRACDEGRTVCPFDIQTDAAMADRICRKGCVA